MELQLITSGVIGLAEAALNRLLRLDPASLEKIRRLDGKLIHIRCTSPPVDLYIQPLFDGLALLSQTDVEPDTRISGSAATLLGLLTATDRQQALTGNTIEISGNIELSQQLQQLLGQLDIDWEAQLAEWIGDIAAHQLGNQLRSLFKWGQQATASMVMNVEEFLHEEARTLPPRAELEQFYSSIESLALDTDRLAARLDRIADKLASNHDNQEV